MSLNLDIAVLLFYLAAIIGCGAWFTRKSPTADEYMSAQRTLPGWAVGLSMFGSYISSISFLANPGASYSFNWNAFAFTLATPIGALIAVRWFVPFYRSSGEISAYEHLEHRFGRWARTYATACFLLLQAARMGAVVYLMAIAVAPLISWDVPTIIAIAASVMTFYTLAGGIKAVVWTGVLQSGVLIAGVVVCIATLLGSTQGGLEEILRSGAEQNKFSLGSFGASTRDATFWVTFLFGLVTHIANFGVDQSYIQRYLSARSTEQARLSVWITTAMYVPVAGVFFLIGTGLFVFYSQRPELLGGAIGDKVFPHFIATQLPAGVSGLVVAAIVAASMDSNLNSMATLTLCDIYKPYLRPQASEWESLLVLKLSTIAWGVVSAGVALAMIRAESALRAWWALSGAFSGGMLGLFLLGLVSRRASSAAAALGVIAGVLVTLWMTLPQLSHWIEVPDYLKSPFHGQLTMVLGTMTILSVGLLANSLAPARDEVKPSAD
jgi:SSS family solute:Na+ symporter